MRPIADVAAEAGIEPDELELFGRYKAKVDLSILERLADTPDAKLINVTAITPTPPGEGKTTTSVSLTQGLGKIGRRAVLALREPSLGPVFGVKGGAAGGGYAQVVPMEDINLHFTGDMHAITAANNLLSALVDAHRFHRHEPEIATVTWRRAIDVTDRQLRSIVGGLGGAKNGIPAESGFDITAASEVMAILALATDLQDLRRKLGAITVGYTPAGEPVTAEDVKAAGRDGRAAEGRAQAEHRPDARGAALLHARRPVREHRARQQLDHRRPHRAQARRVRDHRVRLRRRPRDGEVHGHRLPRRWLSSPRRRDRRDGAGAAPSRRRRLAREGRPRADGGRGRDGDGEPGEAHRERARVRDPAGRRDQHAPRRRAGAARADQGPLARGRRVRCRDPRRLRPGWGGDDRARRGRRRRGGGRVRLPLCSTRTTSRSRRRSRRSRRPSTARTGSSSPPLRVEAIARSRSRGSPTCRSAWRRRISRSRTTRLCATGRRASSSRSATSGSTRAPGMLVPLCGDMLQMPGFGAQPAAFAIDIDEHGETVGLF